MSQLWYAVLFTDIPQDNLRSSRMPAKVHSSLHSAREAALRANEAWSAKGIDTGILSDPRIYAYRTRREARNADVSVSGAHVASFNLSDGREETRNNGT